MDGDSECFSVAGTEYQLDRSGVKDPEKKTNLAAMMHNFKRFSEEREVRLLYNVRTDDQGSAEFAAGFDRYHAAERRNAARNVLGRHE
jgi:hypothetical protein